MTSRRTWSRITSAPAETVAVAAAPEPAPSTGVMASVSTEPGM